MNYTLPVILSGMVKTIDLTWFDIETYIRKINDSSKSNDTGRTTIIGISRGGLVPAVMLSHLKSNSKFYTVGVGSYEGKKKSDAYFYQTVPFDVIRNSDTLYLVDDISDTGSTFKFIIDNMFKNNNSIKILTASIVYKKTSQYKPDYVGYETESSEWINFPWESTK